MNRLLRMLGYRDREYRGADFRVRIEPIFREVISIVYTTEAKNWAFDGEYIGKRWCGIQICIPQQVEPSEANEIMRRLAEALRLMGYGYVISHALEIETVSDVEKENAISELNQMGYKIELLSDGRIRQTKLPGSPTLPLEELKKTTPRMMELIEALHGKRRRYKTLAKSAGF